MKKYEMGTAPLVTFILIVILGIYDLGVVVFGGTSSSVSNFLINAGFSSPVFVFAVGAVCGHLFWYMQPKKEEK